tara:strand:- start:797 stop:1768 length:972 start_codon:yes stop_codon:yes gene_type:complete
MNWWLPHNFQVKQENLLKRAQIMRAVRSYFDSEGFLEVETPIMQVMPGADVHIHGYALENGLYLHNSPEFEMKKLLVAGCEKIYQICKVFRKEEVTKLHSPEFTMLEWYRAGADFVDLITDCKSFITACVDKFEYNGVICDPHQDWHIMTVAEAFEKFADIDIAACLNDPIAFMAASRQVGVRVTATDGWDDVFHAVMAERIEPYLGMGVPTVLCDYPASMASLSRKKVGDERWAERFELYICGVELANAYSELTDAQEQKTRFERDMFEKERIYGERYPIDEDFLKALEHGMPECAGIALGLDRLVMLACGAQNINQVLWVE